MTQTIDPRHPQIVAEHRRRIIEAMHVAGGTETSMGNLLDAVVKNMDHLLAYADVLELWGHDCTRCGNTVPLGEAPCDSCGKDDCLLPLYFTGDELAQMPEGL